MAAIASRSVSAVVVAAQIHAGLATSTAAAAVVLSAAAPALADEAAAAAPDAVELAVQSAEEAVKAAEQALEAGRVDVAVVTAVQEAAEAVEAAFEAEQQAGGAAAAVAEAVAAAPAAATVTEVAADLGDAATAMKQAVSAAQQSAGTDASVVAAIQQAASALTDAAASAQDVAAQVQGLVSPAVTAATPVAKEAVSFLASADPATLAEGALAVVAAAYLLPPVAKASADRLRGYAGDILPSTAFDALVAQGGNLLVDIRTAEEKEATGVPDLPDMGKYVELEFVEVADDRLEARLRNATDVEAELTAVELAALKQLNRGLTLYLLDEAGDTAKAVARELTKRGFSKVFVVAGGCDAWGAAKLRIKPWRTTGLLPAPVELQEVEMAEEVNVMAH